MGNRRCSLVAGRQITEECAVVDDTGVSAVSFLLHQLDSATVPCQGVFSIAAGPQTMELASHYNETSETLSQNTSPSPCRVNVSGVWGQ